ncbi:hypothetical protein N781_17175 [Pontibacillus halophilus JSM 076056 = DSM 19796]|uniref:Uncharacterized protein n=1 Tax=Pontibacillus halophilus JSM 076056 = DSM 19796 TaxID=1385510 RepID=A0A0A5GH22_9BACI|nr:hypothetical protein [Pontibacillus halophilus]KGX92526.1 hypothetical protein N781_17175 [Pontibacillus halophilus JSM 076056 = DSM 19796]
MGIFVLAGLLLHPYYDSLAVIYIFHLFLIYYLAFVHPHLWTHRPTKWKIIAWSIMGVGLGQAFVGKWKEALLYLLIVTLPVALYVLLLNFTTHDPFWWTVVIGIVLYLPSMWKAKELAVK